MPKNTKPRYNSHAGVHSDSSTELSTSSAAPISGPQKKVAPPRKVNSKKLPERAMLKLSAPVTISKLIAANAPPTPAKPPAMVKAA